MITPPTPTAEVSPWTSPTYLILAGCANLVLRVGTPFFSFLRDTAGLILSIIHHRLEIGGHLRSIVEFFGVRGWFR